MAVGLCATGFEQKIMDIYEGKKTNAKNLLKEAVVALSLGKEWLDVSPHQRRVGC